jgi:hypothetical protein
VTGLRILGLGFEAGGSGRKKGSKNKRQTALKRAAEVDVQATLSGDTPLEFMLNIMRDPKQDVAMRADMAKAAAPYVHPRLATTDVTHHKPDTDQNKSAEQLRAELVAEMVELRKAGGAAHNLLGPFAGHSAGARTNHPYLLDNLA